MLRSLFAGVDTIVNAPAGSGKTACFLLALALIQGIGVMVHPLVGLSDALQEAGPATRYGEDGLWCQNSSVSGPTPSRPR